MLKKWVTFGPEMTLNVDNVDDGKSRIPNVIPYERENNEECGTDCSSLFTTTINDSFNTFVRNMPVYGSIPQGVDPLFTDFIDEM